MGDKTGISWTDATWNPIIGCSRVSEGCRNCYAEAMTGTRLKEIEAYKGLTRETTSGPRWTGEVRLLPERLTQPLRWRKPRRIFVNSMSDLFHEALDFEQIAAVFGVMAAAQRHTFQVLTKRPARMLAFFEWIVRGDGALSDGSVGGDLVDWSIRLMGGAPIEVLNHSQAWPLPNVHFGVTVEDQAAADERIPLLLQAPAAVRWVSAEPLLEAVDFWPHLSSVDANGELSGPRSPLLDWIVIGGESGGGSRPFDLAWARSIVEQCREAGVTPFVKQLGRQPYAEGARLSLRNPAGADPEEWPEDLRVREFPEVAR